LVDVLVDVIKPYYRFGCTRRTDSNGLIVGHRDGACTLHI
jgi:hypothetical protein